MEGVARLLGALRVLISDPILGQKMEVRMAVLIYVALVVPVARLSIIEFQAVWVTLGSCKFVMKALG